MTSILNVPYIGQVGEGANAHGNDCGASSVAMIIKMLTNNVPTVDSLYDEVKPSGDSYLSVSDLMILLNKRGIKCDWDAGYAIKDLYWTLTDGIPVIALIRYGALSPIRPNKFTGSHFIVVIGIDLTHVYIHDPLNSVSSGENIAIPIEMFESCWSTVEDYNPQRSMITCYAPASVPAIIKVVYPRDKDGCNIRYVPGSNLKSTILRAVPYGTKLNIYAERDGWGKCHPTNEEWVCMEYTKS
jgi:hypothetical protein